MSDALIAEYLGRLDAAAWPLPASRRSELSTEVREHIESALQEAGSRDETTVRNVLDRLGRPEDIVAAEVDGTGAGQPPAWRSAAAGASGVVARADARGWGPAEIAAVLLLTAGTLLLWWGGPIAGAVVAWFSTRWTQREKRVASIVVFGLLAVQVVVFVVFFVGAFSTFGASPRDMFNNGFGFNFGAMGLAVMLSAVLPFVAGVSAGVYLALALARRY